ncbi:MAG TPA: hypothetical protein VFZ59_13275 [Verrucomicrobiae bacterium]|nr:hypothetical protein [Verrucomicrobiae bacterium]
MLSWHWLGKKRLGAEANATNFMAIWNKPESARLEVQTLDKLASAPWRLFKTPAALSNAPVGLLRPLLDDLVQAESYLEVHGATNQPGELVFAIRLDDARAALWQTNVPVILKSIVASDFQLAPVRVGGWTLLSWSDSKKAQDTKLLAEFRARIQRDGAPYPGRATNYWVEASVDAPGLSEALRLGWKLPAAFPDIGLTMIGDGQNVRTRGEMNFPEPLPELSPWRVPLNLTAEPLTGLTAVRSLTPLLQRLGVLSPEQAAQFPDQFLIWLRAGPPLQVYFAFPSENATNAFWKLAPRISDWVNSHTDAKRYGSITLDTNLSELKWSGLTLCAPFLKSGTNDSGGQYIQGGFGLSAATNVRLPRELHDHINQGTNLLFFDWEFASETLPQWRYLDDVSRMIFDGSHASRLRGSTNTFNWLITNVTNLSHSVTDLRQTASNQLVLTRRSTLGVNAVELDILVNWIEMPDFPRGMSSLWRTNPAPLRFVRATNAAAPKKP